MRSSVFILGLRGLPGVQGGVETHVENLAPLLAKECDVTVLVRACYEPENVNDRWNNVSIKRIWSPKSKALEAIAHTFLGVLYAAVKRPDILHIHAIGPSIMVPLARVLGLKVVITHHGPDYDRQKWGRMAKWVLKTGEYLGAKYSNKVITISKTIQKLIIDKYGIHSELIPNGVTLQPIAESESILSEFGLTPNMYILIVSRLVPEKCHMDLIDAFLQANIAEWKLVIVGSSDHPDSYSEQIMNASENHSNVVTTGFQKGQALSELFSHAGVFVLPSSHEGLPIALLEALGYGLRVIVSDIPANLEVGLDEDSYFPLGNVPILTQKLAEKSQKNQTSEDREKIREWVSAKYDWGRIAQQTVAIYRDVL